MILIPYVFKFATCSFRIQKFPSPHVSRYFWKKFRIRPPRIHWLRVDGRRIRKEKVAASKIYGYVWTGTLLYSYCKRKMLAKLNLTIFNLRLSSSHCAHCSCTILYYWYFCFWGKRTVKHAIQDSRLFYSSLRYAISGRKPITCLERFSGS